MAAAAAAKSPHVRLCETPEMAAHQAPLSLGFSRQEHWSGLPFPSPVHESEKWKWKVKLKSLSSIWLLAIPWTAAYQAPLSMGFSRQEYWSGVPLPSPNIGYQPTKSFNSHWPVRRLAYCALLFVLNKLTPLCDALWLEILFQPMFRLLWYVPLVPLPFPLEGNHFVIIHCPHSYFVIFFLFFFFFFFLVSVTSFLSSSISFWVIKFT